MNKTQILSPRVWIKTTECKYGCRWSLASIKHRCYVPWKCKRYVHISTECTQCLFVCLCVCVSMWACMCIEDVITCNHLSDLSAMFVKHGPNLCRMAWAAQFTVLLTKEQLSPAGLSRTSFAGCDHTLVPTFQYGCLTMGPLQPKWC